MSVYILGTGLSAKGGALDWSETKNKRKPLRGSNRWYVTDANRAPLGPIPEEILAEVNAHFALTPFSDSDLPESFNRLTASHFTGLPVVGAELRDFFTQYCGPDVQFIPVTKFWSLKDKAFVKKERFHINIYGSFPSIDFERTQTQPAISPVTGNERVITCSPYDICVNRIDTGNIHIWRDKATSTWLCDDVFKDAMMAFRPENYHFQVLKY